MPVRFEIPKPLFLEKIQGKEAKLFKSAFDPNELCWAEVNRIVSRSRVEEDAFKIAYNGILPKEKYVERYSDVGTVRYRLIKSAVYEYLRLGATLIANRIHNEPEIEKFSRAVAAYTDRQVVASAYLAFGDRDSYKLHWDTRDVFALQIKGRKRWIAYKPTFEDPLYTQQSKDIVPEESTPTGAPDIDIILAPGDVFYLPKGWWHNPSPLGEESLHLAIGTFPALAMDYISYLVASLQNFAPARASLGPAQDDQLLHAISQHLALQILDRSNYDSFMQQWVESQRIESTLAMELFGQECSDLPLDGEIRLCANSFYYADRGLLIANGIKVNLDPHSAQVIRRIHAGFQLSLADLLNSLPDHNKEKIKLLIFKLCQQDILEWLPSKA